MEWLEAVLAFAVLMMVMSTIVSVLVEMVHRFLGAREKGLQLLVRELYGSYLKPRLAAVAEGNREDPDRFTATITGTRYRPVPGGWAKKLLHRMLRSSEQKELTTLEFIERFAETEEGKDLAAWAKAGAGDWLQPEIEKRLRPVLEDLASKYEALTVGAREYFSRRARLFSVLFALVVAFALHIDAVTVFKTFLENKSVRHAMIDAGEDVAAELQKQLETVQALEAGSAGEDDTATAEADELENVLQEQNDRISKSIADMQSAGVPMGWPAPFWEEAAWVSEGEGWWVGALRGLSILLSGILIGLGGPFWYDTYRKLGALTGIAQGLQTTVQGAKEAAPPTDAEARKRIAEVFVTAIAAQLQPADRGGTESAQ